MFEGKDFRRLVTVNGRDGGIPCPPTRTTGSAGPGDGNARGGGAGSARGLLDTEAYNAGAFTPATEPRNTRVLLRSLLRPDQAVRSLAGPFRLRRNVFPRCDAGTG